MGATADNRSPRFREKITWQPTTVYCPVVMSTILPVPFYKHLLLLVEAVFLLSGSTISLHDLNKADACLFQFVVQFQQLYGINNMNYNVHQLLHLTKTVTDWGPLSCYSSYTFEGFNMVLLKLFHGTQAVPKIICENIQVTYEIWHVNFFSTYEILHFTYKILDFTYEIPISYIK